MSYLKVEKFRVLIVGSSMAMPRKEVHYDETWIYKLTKEFSNIEVIDKCRRASTSVRLVSDGAGAGDKIRSADLLEYYSPNLVITQIGVTDCAPRLFKVKGFFSYLFYFLPQAVNKQIINVLKKYRGRKEKFAYVSSSKFKENWEQYFKRCQDNNVQVICILISLPSSLALTKNPPVLRAINKYNSILTKLSNKYKNVHVLVPYTQDEIDATAIDEYHVNAKGHKILFEKLKNLIQDKLIDN